MSDSSESSVKSPDTKDDGLNRAEFRKQISVLETEMIILKRLIDHLKQKAEVNLCSNKYDKIVKRVDFFITLCGDTCTRTDFIKRAELDALITGASEINHDIKSIV